VQLVLVQLPLRSAPGTHNWELVRGSLESQRLDLCPQDVVVLPELLDARPEPGPYEDAVRELAGSLGCHVVGGSHHERRSAAKINSGIVADSEGRIVSRYQKRHPYGGRSGEVASGSGAGELRIAGRRALVVLCADFWFSDVFQRARGFPDLVLVPACSVTRKPSPRFARALWQHMAVARAYEFGAFVGISDWARDSEIPRAPGAVAGFADPTRSEPGDFFTPVGARGLATHVLDFQALDDFRADRVERGFFWRPASGESVTRSAEASMSITERYLAYAVAFEQAFASDDWTAVEAFFTEDAVYDVALDPPLGGRYEGRAAILAYFKDILDRLDRRFESREGAFLEGPRADGERVWTRGRVVYRAAGVPDAIVEVEEVAYFDGDRIRRLEDRYDAATKQRISDYLATYGRRLGVELSG
jgi:omega-amidase